MNNTGQKFRLPQYIKIILTLLQRLIRELKKCFHSLGIHVESKLVYKFIQHFTVYTVRSQLYPA